VVASDHRKGGKHGKGFYSLGQSDGFHPSSPKQARESLQEKREQASVSHDGQRRKTFAKIAHFSPQLLITAA